MFTGCGERVRAGDRLDEREALPQEGEARLDGPARDAHEDAVAERARRREHRRVPRRAPPRADRGAPGRGARRPGRARPPSRRARCRRAARRWADPPRARGEARPPATPRPSTATSTRERYSSNAQRSPRAARPATRASSQRRLAPGASSNRCSWRNRAPARSSSPAAGGRRARRRIDARDERRLAVCAVPVDLRPRLRREERSSPPRRRRRATRRRPRRAAAVARRDDPGAAASRRGRGGAKRARGHAGDDRARAVHARRLDAPRARAEPAFRARLPGGRAPCRGLPRSARNPGIPCESRPTVQNARQRCRSTGHPPRTLGAPHLQDGTHPVERTA